MGFMKALINVVTGKGTEKLFDGSGALGGDYVDRQLFQQAGFTSLPREGSQAVVLKRGDNYICVATSDQPDDTPDLNNAGDVAIYASTDYIIKISVAGEIEIKGNGNSGSIVLGTGVVDKLMKDSIITKYNGHTHLDPVSGSTGVPNTLFDSTDATTQVQGS